MVEYNSEYNKVHGKVPVLTAKPTNEMFKNVEHIRWKAQLNSRNDAILVLLAFGLHAIGEVSEETLKQYLERYGAVSLIQGARR